MNFKVMSPIIAGIVIAITGAIIIAGDGSDDQEPIRIDDQFNGDIDAADTPDIDKKLDDIEKKASENDYSPKTREWMVSGPFQIDRSQYVLGEKIFMRASELGFDEKGEVAFLRPSNETHYSVYLTLPFDGSENAAFNYYIEPKLSERRGYCTVDDFVGEWRVVFRGTDYANLEFEITEDILPGDEELYEPVC